MVDEQSTANMEENFPKIMLSTLVVGMEVLYEPIMGFANLKLKRIEEIISTILAKLPPPP